MLNIELAASTRKLLRTLVEVIDEEAVSNQGDISLELETRVARILVYRNL